METSNLASQNSIFLPVSGLEFVKYWSSVANVIGVVDTDIINFVLDLISLD